MRIVVDFIRKITGNVVPTVDLELILCLLYICTNVGWSEITFL